MDAKPTQPPAQPEEEAPPHVPWFRLLDEREIFRLLIEEMGVVITELDAEGQITFVTRTTKSIMGYEPAEVIGLRGREWIHPGDVELATRENPNSEEEYSDWTLYRTRHKDGSWVWMETVWESSFEDSDGSKRRVMVTRDVTQLKATRDALRENEERYRTVVESTDDVVTEHDAKGAVVFASPNIHAVLGRSRSEIYGRDLLSLVHPDDVARIAQNFFDAASSRLPTRFAAYRVRRGDGTWAWFQSTGISYRHRNGESRFLNIGRDISGLVSQELERQEFETRIGRAQRIESFGVMAGGIAHDFSNLLTPLLSDTALAIAELSAEEPALPRLKRVRQAAQRASELTNQLLSYAGSGYFDYRSLDLSEITEQARSVLYAAAGEHASLTFELAAELPLVLGDRASLLKTILDLVTNAAEATDSTSGEIVIRTGTACPPEELALDFPSDVLASECVFLEVEDNGSGIDEETRERIFDPFFTTRFTGRGLGLASVLGIVRAHSAGVELESVFGRGTRFRILIPPHEETKALAASHAREAAHTARDRETILVIEDDVGTREVVEDILAGDGFRVLFEEDGESGVRSMGQRGQKVSLVILDFTLPDGPSPVVFERIREIRPGVKVLLMSGHTQRTATAPFAGKNLSGFLHKPFLPEQLLEAVHGLLTEPEDPKTASAP